MWSDAARQAANDARSKGSGVKQYFANQRSQFGSYTGPDRRGSAEAPLRNAASDGAAADALMAGVKSGVVPIHDSMAGRASNPTTAPSPQNRRAGEGVMKGERTLGQDINKHVVSQARAKLRGWF
jgi:hypothetical protein